MGINQDTLNSIISGLGNMPKRSDIDTLDNDIDISATQTVNGLMSAADKLKLDGIATGANKYVHPTTSGYSHIPSGGSNGQILRWASDGTAKWTTETIYNTASSTSNGLMSSTDKANLDAAVSKLNGISEGANKYILPTASNTTLGGVKTISDVSSTSGLTACPIINGVPYYKDTVVPYSLPTASSSELGGVTTTSDVTSTTGLTACPIIAGVPYYKAYSAATTSDAGLMSATDKSTLDAVSSKYALKSKYGDTTINVGRKNGTTTGTSSTAEGYNTTASGSYSHAEGSGTTASGYGSHAEGSGTTSSGGWSHAEGSGTTSSGDGSHAEGFNTTASGSKFSSHAEGVNTIASGIAAHAEGGNVEPNGLLNKTPWSVTISENTYEILSTTADAVCSHAEGGASFAHGTYSHAEGYHSLAFENCAHAEGDQTQAIHRASHSEGYQTTASGGSSHAEGTETTASGSVSHAEGGRTTASGDYSHAEGSGTTASGNISHAEGSRTTASGSGSHAEGANTTASDHYSHAEGYSTTTGNWCSHVSGHFNAAMVSGGLSNNTTGTAFVIGNGTASDALSNAFSVQYDGTVKAASTITASTTADYAEFFEWLDENPDNEDRVGYFVTLDGDRIRIATNEDNYILGVVSGEPFVLGNGDCDTWNGMFLHDEFRRTIYEPAPKMEEILDDEGNPTGELKEVPGEYEGTRPKLNPDYDYTKPYISRFERKEWSPVGMLGVLAVRHDGTAQINGYVTVDKNGIATACDRTTENSYRVIKHNSDSVVEIIFR